MAVICFCRIFYILFLVIVCMKKKRKTLLKWTLFAIIAIVLIWSFIRPSNDRNWTVDQMVLGYYEQEGNLIHVFNIRNFTYNTTSEYSPSYYNKTFDLNKLSSVDYIVEPFSDWEGAAHTFVSFGFEGDYLAVSIEIRKEIGESFSGLKGLFKQYELMYVLGDEKDLVKLRSNYRKDNVFIYPINASKEKIKLMLLDMLDRTNKLKEKPEFYNTLTNTCTTNLVKHVNKITPHKIPFSFKILAPGYSDELAYNSGLMNTTLSFEEIREYYKINDRAMKYADDPDFSKKIREYEN